MKENKANVEDTENVRKIKSSINKNLSKKFDEYIKEAKLINPKLTKQDIYNDLANECGVSEDTVSRWKTGTRPPAQIEYIVFLCKKFGCSLDELLNGIYLSEKDKEELLDLGFSEDAAIKLIEYFSKDNMKSNMEKDISKAGITQYSKDIIKSYKKEKPEQGILFGPKNILPKAKYSKLLNDIIIKNFLNNSFMEYIDTYREEIFNKIIKKKYKEVLNSNNEDKDKKTLDIILNEYRKEIVFNKDVIPSNQIRPKKLNEKILRNISKDFPETSIEKLNEMENKMVEEYRNFLHNAMLDMLFQSQENKENKSTSGKSN